MASLTWWTWVWTSSWIWWWPGKTDVLQSMALQRVRQDWVAQLSWIQREHQGWEDQGLPCGGFTGEWKWKCWLLGHSLFQGIFSTQGLNLSFLHCRQILYHLKHQGSPHRGEKMFIWKQACAGNQQKVDVGVGSHSLRGAERDSEGTRVFSGKKQVSGSNPPLLLTDFPEGLSQSSTDMYSFASLLKSSAVCRYYSWSLMYIESNLYSLRSLGELNFPWRRSFTEHSMSLTSTYDTYICATLHLNVLSTCFSIHRLFF